jgi:hypothetical protein
MESGTMHLMGEGKSKSRVAITIWDRNGNPTSKGKYSKTFTVEDTTMEELEKFIKESIRKAKTLNYVPPYQKVS